MSLRNLLTSLLVMTVVVVGLMLALGDPVRFWTVVRVVLIAALASVIVAWFNNRKAARG